MTSVVGLHNNLCLFIVTVAKAIGTYEDGPILNTFYTLRNNTSNIYTHIFPQSEHFVSHNPYHNT